MTDLDEAFKTALSRARGAGPVGGSPVTISSGSTLGKNIFVTPMPSTGQNSGSDRPRSDGSNEHFFSAGSTDGTRSNVSSTYFSQTPSLTSLSDLRTATNLRSETVLTTANSETQVPTTAFTSFLTVLPSHGPLGAEILIFLLRIHHLLYLEQERLGEGWQVVPRSRIHLDTKRMLHGVIILIGE